MQRLNYSLLEELTTQPTPVGENLLALEVTNVDVKRLRDDRSEITGGQDIAFVATATFRATSDGIGALRKYTGAGNLAVGDELFVIGSDAELRSDTLPIDEDSVSLWINDHYTFTFTLNGEADTGDGPFQDLGAVAIVTDSPSDADDKLALPWLRKLNTGAFKDGFIDVDVRIAEKDTEPTGYAAKWAMEPSFTVRVIKTTGPNESQDAMFDFVLEVDDTEDSPIELGKDGLRVALVGAPTGVRLALVPHAPGPGGAPVKKKPADAPRPNATTTPPKQKP
jgi:hypothetical protein